MDFLSFYQHVVGLKFLITWWMELSQHFARHAEIVQHQVLQGRNQTFTILLNFIEFTRKLVQLWCNI